MKIGLALSSTFLGLVFAALVVGGTQKLVGPIPVEFAFIDLLLWAGFAIAWYHKNAIGRYLGRRYAKITH